MANPPPSATRPGQQPAAPPPRPTAPLAPRPAAPPPAAPAPVMPRIARTSMEKEKIEAREIRVNFPFLVSIEHEDQDLKGMFTLTSAFDLYEMEDDATDNEGLVKENFTVDVMEVTPKVTTLKITPVDGMTYESLSLHIDLMMRKVSKKIFKKEPKAIRLTWEIDKTGVSSDLRGQLRAVK